jgi:hypothetical protein
MVISALVLVTRLIVCNYALEKGCFYCRKLRAV